MLQTAGKGFLLTLFILSGSLNLNAQNIEVKITGIRSEKGQIVLTIYTDEESYREEIPQMTKIIDKNGIKEGTMTVLLDLEAGIYGLGLIDDENRNGEMDFKFIRVTKEGFGFSNFYLTKLRKPSFDDFKFEVKEGHKQKVEMKIKYM